MISRVGATMTALRQLRGDRKDFARLMIPQRLEGGQLLAVGGGVLGSWDGEDQEIYPAELMDQKVVTDAWLNKLFEPVNKLFGSASEQEAILNSSIDGLGAEGQIPDEDGPEPAEEDDNSPSDLDIDAEESNSVDTSKLEKAIKKGNAEKAQKLLKGLKEDLPKDAYKAFKKQVKGL